MCARRWTISTVSYTHLDVYKRQVRDGEANTVDTSRIVKNDDAIMPYQWYLNQKQDPHPFYTDPSYVIPTVNVTTTSSGGTGTLPAGTTASTTPTAAVSYTPLDVYKRQVQHGLCLLIFTGKFSPLTRGPPSSF